MDNALIVHGGAPTAVINASLYGVVSQLKEWDRVGSIYAALGGTGGILRRQFLDMASLPQSQLDLLPCTPSSAIGTSRDRLNPEDYEKIARIIKEKNIRYVFFNGGNGTMDTCGKVYEACCAVGAEVQVVGIPKTIDNDIAVTDHAPGFGSAARYVAATVSEVALDVHALPIHVVVLETMGRDAGWIAASSALARETGFGPDLIYTPEHPFDEENFLNRVSLLRKEKGGVLVVVSEGLKNQKGDPIVPPIFKVDRSVYFGNVSAHLASLVIKNLGIKARSEKPGLCGRSSVALQSSLDRKEAELAGRMAVRAAQDGQTGVMVGFQRNPSGPYETQTTLIPIHQVMLEEKMMPKDFISTDGSDVTPAFVEWCRPLIGGPLPRFVDFRS